ncbi:MATE family efflux transporter [Filobacillus milosensis]|uniref:Probable multidrug resistance protein NorM n=1 Tax=Filobacillus milosensis TaxID=94137 RepID=A0A4Y8IKC2_9BACI|nr:MATE family efflux transporter [Filobacillus milosensis]TFB21416.1 MATE family efflux transporter [Filobacillus milosensis]
MVETKYSQKDIFKMIMILAIPAIVENFFQTILGFVDTYFVSQIGINEVTAVGVTNAILAIYLAIFMSVGVSTNVYIAKYIGSNQIEKAGKVAKQSILLSVIIGLLFGIITFLFAEPLLKLMGIEKTVLDQGVIYFKIVAIPSVLISLMFGLSSILRGTKDTKTPMKVTIFINIINIILDYVFIFGFWLIPSFGLAGAAWATVIARLVGVILLIFYVKKSKIGNVLNLTKWSWDKEQQKELIKLGTPAMAERLAMRIGQVIYFGFIVQLGTNTFAAHQITGNIEVFSYMIGYGFATAATTLIGEVLGSRQYELAKKIAYYSTFLGVGVMSIFGLFLFVFGEWTASFFTNDIFVIQQITIALKIDAFIQPILAIVLILTGAFQGAENSKYPFYLTTIGIWLLRTVGVYVLGIWLGMGIAGIWIAIGLDNLFRAILLFLKIHNNKWVRSTELTV